MSAESDLASVAEGAEASMRALGWMPIKTLILADVVMDDGSREVAIAMSDDMRSTDSLGLLQYAVAREMGGIANEMRHEGDE